MMRLFRFYISYLVLPNLVFVVAMQFVYMGRAIINVDYLLLGAISSFLPTPILITIYVLLLTIDFFSAFAPVYHMGLGAMLMSMKYALNLNIKAILPFIIGCLFAVIAISFLARRISPRHERFAVSNIIAALAMIVFVYALDIANNTNRLRTTYDRAFVPVNVAYSAATKIIIAGKQVFTYVDIPQEHVKVDKADMATGELFDQLSRGDISQVNKNKNIVYILHESMGLLKNQKSNKLFLAPFFKPEIENRYIVKIGSIKTKGATVSAELRDLCGMATSFQARKNYIMPKCIPEYLKSLGFKTFAFHGFSKIHLDRCTWYPSIGFDNMMFAADAGKIPGVKYCGSLLRGISDLDMANLIRKELLKNRGTERKFIYWLTLNAHIPMDESCIPGSTFDCNSDEDASRYKGLCTWMKIIYLVNSKIAEMALESELAPTLFIVVGDHSPSFLRKDIKNLFVENEVLTIELIPRQ